MTKTSWKDWTWWTRGKGTKKETRIQNTRAAVQRSEIKDVHLGTDIGGIAKDPTVVKDSSEKKKNAKKFGGTR